MSNNTNHIEQAQKLYRKRQWQQLDGLYAKIKNESTVSAELIYLMATSKVAQFDNLMALDFIEQGINLEKDNALFYELKGIVIAKQGDSEKALMALKKALKNNANLYQAQLLSGHLNYALGDKKKAEFHFNMASKIDDKNPEAQASLAKIILDEGEAEKAIILLRDLESQHPNNASIRMILGQAFIESGAYSFAEKYFEKVLETHPNFELAQLYIGMTKLYDNKIEEAEKIIRKYCKNNTNTKEGIAALGLLNYKLKNYQKAADYLNIVQKQSSVPVSWKLSYIESLVALKKYKPAIAFYEAHIDKIKILDGHYRLAQVYELSEKFLKAIETYQKVEKDQEKIYFLSLVGQTRCYLALNYTTNAYDNCKKAYEIDKNNIEVQLLMVECQLLLDKHDEALELIKKVKNNNSLYTNTFNILKGLILNENKKYTEAMSTFEENTRSAENIIYQELTEQELKTVQHFDTNKVDERKNPIFVIGSQSTAILKFATWLEDNDIIVFKDRLFESNRTDVMHALIEMKSLEKYDESRIRIQRKRYFQKAKAYNEKVNENSLFVDFIFIHPYHISSIKKFFPQAQVLLLNRDTADIWMYQKIFGLEQIQSKKWNEAVNQILSMKLNLTQLDIDKWLNNDPHTIQMLNEFFNTEFKIKVENDERYWRKELLAKGSWKNYQKYLLK